MDLKKIGKKLLYPPLWLMIILTVLSTVALTAVFVKGLETSPVAYVAYAVAFYTLSVVTIACIKVFPGYYRSAKQKVYDNKFGNLYMTDAVYRTRLSLYMSLGINLLYAAVNLFAGIWYGSVWSITLAAYYIILAVMRFLLLRFANQTGIGKDRIKELRRSRLCGFILMTVNLALSGVVILVIVQNKGFEYNGMLIYVMAMYTFYVTPHSVINIFKHRKYNSPVMFVSKIISLTAALVSMLSLETAMLSQFGGENASPYFNRIMVGATGAGVSIIVLTMSVYTIVRANIELKKLKNNNS